MSAAPTKYYITARIRLTAAHDLAFVLFFFNPPSRGGLAQLVERLLCKQNVNGSNPLTSTTFHDPPRAPGNTCGARVLEINWACSSVG